MSILRLHKLISIAFLAGLLSLSLAFGGLVICRKCGYEVPEGKTSCTHCGADAPVSKVKKDVDRDETRSNKGESIDARFVKSQMRLGDERIKKGDFDTARLFFKNAAALEMLTDSDDGGRRSKSILASLKKCDSGGSFTKAVCEGCGGKGERVLSARMQSGEVKERQVHGSKCAQCGGTGYVFKSGRASERKFAIGRALARYTTLQQAAKMVPIGGAWVPRAIEDSLSVRQKVVLKRATAAPCDECLGVGRVDCKECKGWGRIECTNRQCDDGFIERKNDDSLIGSRMKRRDKCGVCKGKNFVVCRDCRGKGTVPCKDCDGIGERDPCRKCSGQGTENCRKCRGSGSYKGVPCVDCGRTGVVECRSCSGEGRKR